ncbi:DUF3991 and TOPRIM domain-containing protein [Pygmaiobacter massiliensis]|uniref:DUF3991 and TOPRIM domain-containing protein n=1 Tax=Pygmaiobacter massiliensis TaxID=1917873 RepID=UPI000C799B5A|nr:DUF3991 and TOPRIM domain-containing protein [Pygmaiobacter massiliensis]
MTSLKLTEAIKRDILIPDFARTIGFTPEKHGMKGKMILKEHDSLVISEDGKLFTWNSICKSGSVIDFAMIFLNLNRQEAIATLRGLLGHDNFKRKLGQPPLVAQTAKKQLAFLLPERAKERWTRLYAYLSSRGICKEVIDYAVKEKLIYQDKRGNLCFVGYDYNGKACYGNLKSTATGNHFRQYVEGGNAAQRFSIHLIQRNREALFVCEAGVDVLSIMTLLHLSGKDFRQFAYLSLDCCDVQPIATHLRENPQLKRIYLCQDNDNGGKKSVQQAFELIREAGFSGDIIPKLPKAEGEDYNDYLRNVLNNKGEYNL